MAAYKFNASDRYGSGSRWKLYLLEYGTGWFTKNPDAGLSRIDYNAGNRAPKIENITVDKTSGALPFQLMQLSRPKILKVKTHYIWDLRKRCKKRNNRTNLEYTYDKAGDYAIVEVRDEEKAGTKSGVVSVYAGNEAPMVNIALKGNKTFYFPGKPVEYNVSCPG